MKNFILIFAIFLSSCGGGKYYILSISSNPKTTTKLNKRVGVSLIKLPAYLYKRNLYTLTSSSNIKIDTSAVWAEDLDRGLTTRLVSFLQNRFNNPNIFTYPWGGVTNPNIIIKIEISKFIYQNDRVYLQANYKIINTKNSKSKSRLFRDEIISKNNPNEIIDNMNLLFSRFESRVADGITSSP